MKMLYSLLLSLACITCFSQNLKLPSIKDVYNQERLIVYRDIEIDGTVEQIEKEFDGDLHIKLKLDTLQQNLLNENIVKFQNNCIVLEVVCIVKTVFPFNCKCKNYKNSIIIPKRGDRITVRGIYVFDTVHEWFEIHPVQSILIK